MSDVFAIASSGLRAADLALGASAYNLAHVQTEGLRRERVVQTAAAGGGVTADTVHTPSEGAAMHEELVAQMQARNAYLANLAVFRAGAGATGFLLDVFA